MNEVRYEIKLVLNESQLNDLLILIKQQRFKHPHPKRIVNSLYFDTYDFSSVKDNISGISDRKKIRLRWYDNNNNTPLLEIKKRYGRVGDKRKIKTTFKSGEEIESLSAKNIFDRLLRGNYDYDHFFFDPNFKPILWVRYQREYFLSSEGLRLTIDKKIQFSQVSYFKPISFQKKMNYNKNIIEIKFPIEMKELLNKILRRSGLIPVRHSKYLVGLSKLGLTSYI